MKKDKFPQLKYAFIYNNESIDILMSLLIEASEMKKSQENMNNRILEEYNKSADTSDIDKRVFSLSYIKKTYNDLAGKCNEIITLLSSFITTENEFYTEQHNFFIAPYLELKEKLIKQIKEFDRVYESEVSFKKMFIKGKHTSLGMSGVQMIQNYIQNEINKLHKPMNSETSFETYALINEEREKNGELEIPVFTHLLHLLGNMPVTDIWADNAVLLGIKVEINNIIEDIYWFIQTLLISITSCNIANEKRKVLYITEKLLNDVPSEPKQECIDALANIKNEGNVAFNFKTTNEENFFGAIEKNNEDIFIWIYSFDVNSIEERRNSYKKVNVLAGGNNCIHIEFEKENEKWDEYHKEYMSKIINVLGDYFLALKKEKEILNISSNSTVTEQKNAERRAVKQRYGKGNLIVHYFSVNKQYQRRVYVNGGSTGTGTPKSPHYRNGTYRYNKKTGKRDIAVKPCEVHKEKMNGNDDRINPSVTILK